MEIAAQAAMRQCITYSAEHLTRAFNRIQDFEAQIHETDPTLLRLAGMSSPNTGLIDISG